MYIKLLTKHQSNVINEQGMTEEHYVVFKLSFRSSTQSPLIMLTKEYCYSVMCYADIIFTTK